VPRLRRRRPRSFPTFELANLAFRSRACRVGFIAGFAAGCLLVLACVDSGSPPSAARAGATELGLREANVEGIGTRVGHR